MTADEVRSEVNPIKDSARRLVMLLLDDLRRRNFEHKRIPVSFSGGLDSTLIAKLCSDVSETYCIASGTEGSVDIKNARTSAGKLGIELREIILDERIVLEGAKEICSTMRLNDPLIVSFELPTYLALKSAEEDFIVTGQGADELFGGYAKYEGLETDTFSKLRKEDLNKVLGPIDAIEIGMAARWEKTIMKPFLCNRIVSFAMALPLETVQPSKVRKPIIREALVELGLAEAAKLPKKASQYGSGVSDILKKAARKRGQRLSEMIDGFAKGDGA
jgi:asparagine synthase (glutamine-hydrolysing)